MVGDHIIMLVTSGEPEVLAGALLILIIYPLLPEILIKWLLELEVRGVETAIVVLQMVAKQHLIHQLLLHPVGPKGLIIRGSEEAREGAGQQDIQELKLHPDLKLPERVAALVLALIVGYAHVTQILVVRAEA